MSTITIPAGDLWPDRFKAQCAHYGCEAKYDQKTDTFTITTEDPANFFWLGCNMNNARLNQLNGHVQQLQKAGVPVIHVMDY